MPAPAPAWNLVRVYGTWHNLDGTKKAGSYKVTIAQRVTSITDNVMIPAGAFISGSLTSPAGVPSLDIMVPAVDDPDISPQGATIVLEVTFSDGSAPEKFNLSPSINGPDVNLRTIILPSSAPVVSSLLYRGVPGGIAELDADGDVIDADGFKVTVGDAGSGGALTTLNVVAAAGTTEALPATANYHDVTLNVASCAISLPSVAVPTTLTLLLRQDGTGSRAVTFPNESITWLGTSSDTSPPDLNTGPGAVTNLTLTTVNGGTSWLGTKVGGTVTTTAPTIDTAVLPQTIPFIVRSQ